MDKPNLDKLPDYLAFLDQLKKDAQVPTKSMLPFLTRAFLELTIEQAWQVLSYWQESRNETNFTNP